MGEDLKTREIEEIEGKGGKPLLQTQKEKMILIYLCSAANKEKKRARSAGRESGK